jgi:putative colanic acid biosynthesis UDP-glucose lipid carrier transferase
MSRKGLAPEVEVSAAAPAILGPPPASAFRVPLSMVLDLIMLAEVGLSVLAATLAKLVYIALVLDSSQALEPYVVAGVVGGIIAHYTMRSRGLCEPSAFIEWRKRVYDLLVSIGLSFLALIALAYLFKLSSNYSRGWVLTWMALVFALLPASRPLSAMLLRWLTATGSTVRRVVVVASEASGLKFAERLRATPGVAVAGIFQLSKESGQQGDTVADLINMGQRNEFDEVIVAASDALHPCAGQLVEELRVLPVDVWVYAADLDMPIHGVSRIGGASLFQVSTRTLRDWGYVSKLALDYVVGTISLILFAPLMLAVAVAIKLESPGPVFFRQRRHGYNHRLIDVYKFRSMTVAENGDHVVQAKKNDARVTRVGKFLRRTSLDELPQLFNVLKGEMSLVGPRPHAVAHNQHYRERLQRYANRHCVKPGMTGWAQVNGFRGPTEDPEKMRKRVEADLYYIENWSLWLDIKILALTPLVGFVHRNAI